MGQKGSLEGNEEILELHKSENTTYQNFRETIKAHKFQHGYRDPPYKATPAQPPTSSE